MADPTKIALHGTRGTYTKGCRCELCTLANRRYARKYWREHYGLTADKP